MPTPNNAVSKSTISAGHWFSKARSFPISRLVGKAPVVSSAVPFRETCNDAIDPFQLFTGSIQPFAGWTIQAAFRTRPSTVSASVAGTKTRVR
jgi:hypothetical protein